MTLPGANSREIAFQDRSRTDRVTAVLVPIDRTTRRPVTSGVSAWLWDRSADKRSPFRLIKNLSGSFVLLNQPVDATYDFRIDPSSAGYQEPVEVSFNPKADGLRRIVPLDRRTDYPFEDQSTLVRGMVVRGDGASRTAIPGATVSVLPGLELADDQVPSLTDKNGGFAVLAKLKPEVNDAPPAPLTVTLRFTPPSGSGRDIDVELKRFEANVFSKPIDLASGITPPFHPDE